MAERRQQGLGSIDELPSGKWRVRVIVNGERITELCATQDEAERLRAAFNIEKRALVPAEEPEVLTLRRWGATWLDDRETSGGIRNTPTERRNWKNHVLTASFADLPLTSVTKKMLREWARSLAKCPAKMMAKGGKRDEQKTRSKGHALSRATISNLVAMLRKCFSDAVREEHLLENPARDLPIPKAATTHEAFTILDAKEIELACSSAVIPSFERCVYTVAIYQGLRAGELWALRWDDLDLEHGTMWVRRSHKGPTKSGKPRMIPLFELAALALRTLRSEREPNASDLVFPSPRGHQRLRGDDAGWSSRKVRGKHRVGFRERAGIARRVRLHDLRHTTASHLVMGTWGKPWELTDVQVFLRHASFSTTLKYAHLSPAHLQAKAAETARVLTPTIAPTVAEVGVSSPAPDSSTTPPEAAHRDQPELVTEASGIRSSCVSSGNLLGGLCGARSHDQRIKSPFDSSVTAQGYGPHDQPVTNEENPVELAVQVLRAVARGSDPNEAANALVVNVLRSSAPGSKGWTLALSVLEGATHRATRALDLAELVLDEGVPAKARSTG